MREIKFRAWDKFKKEMRKVDKMDFHNKKGIIVWFLNGEKILYPKQSTEIMQYTGLKDKNGKEIYEGYIVEFWVDGCAKSRTAKVKFNTERGRWILFATIGHHRDLTAEKASKCEIVGNIFENSELLK